jgi:hypothetical protein
MDPKPEPLLDEFVDRLLEFIDTDYGVPEYELLYVTVRKHTVYERTSSGSSRTFSQLPLQFPKKLGSDIAAMYNDRVSVNLIRSVHDEESNMPRATYHMSWYIEKND